MAVLPRARDDWLVGSGNRRSRGRTLGRAATFVGACHFLLAAAGARADGESGKGLDLLGATPSRSWSEPAPATPEFRILHLR
jgi:hypothetical protein